MPAQSNRQQYFSQQLQTLSSKALEPLCVKGYCKLVFGLSRPLLLKVPLITSITEKHDSVRDEQGVPLYHWRFEFHKEDGSYAFTTEWPEGIEERIQMWLERQ